MIQVQLYGNNIANTRMMASAEICPVTTSDAVKFPDKKTLTEKILELEKRIEKLEKENELKKQTKKIKNE